jgi:hypothetical protein
MLPKFLDRNPGEKLSTYTLRAHGSEKGKTLGSIGKFLGFGDQVDKLTQAGANLGEAAGKLLPFKKGGRVKRTGKALVHKGEFILPKGVSPTKSQIKKVRKRGGIV